MSASSPASDRNLLFGILALQMDFISRDALIAAMNAWVLDKAKPLGQILLDQGQLTPERLQLLDALVREHLKAHDNDPQHSLAAVTPSSAVHQVLRSLGDEDLEASLAVVGSARAAEPEATIDDSRAAPPSLLPGLRYRILRPHAKGGLGEVSVAEDQELHREVALKEIQPRHAHDPISRSRFLLEAEVTGRLEHPGIVPVYGLGQYADGRPFYAMRFVKGDNLKEAIRRFHEADVSGRDPSERSLAFRQLLGRFVDVCHAIAYAHSRGVLHRDLKPGNIMLGKYGETLVVDWGLAKPIDRPEPAQVADEATFRPSSGSGLLATQMGTAIGTPAYMSPEQASGRLDLLGPASDIYSLGATLYALLTGQAPFHEEDLGDVLQKVQRGDVVWPRQVKPGTPAALEAVCRQAMALKPEERYPTALALAADVEHWLADEPVSAYREPLPDQLRRWARRHPALVAGAAVLLVTAVVALSLSTALIERERARAEESFRQARATVDDYFTTVSESRLLDVPGLQPLRKELLEKALHYYEGFLHQRGNDLAVRAETAATSYRLARISQLLGSADAAVASYRKALDLYEQLVRAHPGVPKYQSDLAICGNDFGNCLRSLGQPAEALRLHRQALEYREALARAHPDNARFQNELAKSNANLGGMLFASGQPVEALASYEQARAINETLVRAKSAVLEFPTDLGRAYNTPRTFLFDLAIDYGAISAIQDHLGQSAEALRSSRQAAALLEGLTRAHPGKTEFRSHLVGCYNQIGYLLSRSGQLAEGMDSYQKALTLLERLVAENPHVPDFQSQLAGTYNNLGRLKRDQGQAAEALPFHQQALAIQEKLVREHPGVVSYQATLAYLHRSLGRLQAQTGQHAEALQGFRKAQAIDEPYAATYPLSCYNLACDLALCLPVVDASERPRVAEQALETLQRALRAGFQDVHLIKTDPDLDALRAREDFQKLLRELEGKAEPPAR